VEKLIVVDKVTKVFEDTTGNTGGAVEAIRTADFQVRRGEFVSLDYLEENFPPRAPARGWRNPFSKQ
jgi:hypothetical protein